MQRREKTKHGTPIIVLPTDLAFNHNGIIDFDHVLSLFNWDIKNAKIIINGTRCKSANYQTSNTISMASKTK